MLLKCFPVLINREHCFLKKGEYVSATLEITEDTYFASGNASCLAKLGNIDGKMRALGMYCNMIPSFARALLF